MRALKTIGLALILFGCSDTRLWKAGALERISVEANRPRPVEPEQRWGFVARPADAVRYTLGDAFCTRGSVEVTVPFKLLVIMDYSGSMDMADPQGLRIDAVEALINQYRDDPSVYFGFLRFGSLNYPLATLGKDFTNEAGRIQAALTELRADNTVPQGATNYQQALEWAWDAIDTDMRRPDQTPGTRYGILFVTDGRPNEPEQGTPDQALAANRPKVRDRITGCDGYKADQPLNTMIEWLNTYFINVQGPDPLGSQLLRDMAEGNGSAPCDTDNWGHGQFTEVDDPADLEFDLDLPKLRKVFVNRGGFFFVHHQLRAAYQGGEMVMARDSDGDGLADFLESDDPGADPWSSSRFLGDTDGDGISDLVAWSLGLPTNQPMVSEPHPRPPPAPELLALGMLDGLGVLRAQPEDKDGDGLSDDEELFLGTDERKVDSDRDGLPDALELRFFLNPLDGNDAALDADGDGLDARSEIETGMDPHHQEPDWFRQKYAYQVSRGDERVIEEVDPTTGRSSVRTCYDFSIRNILFRPALRPQGVLSEQNLFELSFLDQTRIPAGERELDYRRELFWAKPEQDRPGFYLRRTLPEHW